MEQDQYLRVEGTTLVRDKQTKSIINTNEAERQQYLLRKKAIKSKESRIDLLESRIADLEAQVKSLMGMLIK